MTHFQVAAFLGPFVMALVTAAVATPLARGLALRLGLVARPKVDRWNSRTVPLLGGLPVWAATMLAVLAWGRTSDVVELVAGGSTLFAVGLVDDRISLKPGTKLSAHVVVACAIVAYGLQLHWTGSALLNSVLTVVWIVGITNAFNLLDNMDGLCAGIAVITASALYASLGPGTPGALVVSAAVAGAALGFLFYNIAPASIFLGDSGSLFLGGTLALLALSHEPVTHRSVLATLAVPVLLLLLPIFDTTFVTIARKLAARSASRGGRDHTSHRLVAMGFSERQALLVLYALAAAGGLAAFGLSRANVEFSAFGVLLVIGLILLGVHLARVAVYDGEDFTVLQNRRFTPLLVELTYKRRVFEVILDTCLIGVAYYLAYALRFAESFSPLYYDLFARSLPVVVACQLTGMFVAGVYRGVWRYIVLTDLLVYVRGVGLGTLGTVLLLVYLYRFENYSRTVFMIQALVQGVLVVGARLAFRWLSEQGTRLRSTDRRALIYGAGDGGVLLVRELRSNPRHCARPIAFLDDDPMKQRRRIFGLRIMGGIEDLRKVIAETTPDLVIISTSKLRPDVRRRLEDECRRAGKRLLQMHFEIADGSGLGRVVTMP